MREEGERQFVLLVTERRGQFLEKRFIGPVHFGDVLQAQRFALQPKLRRGVEDAADFFLRQTAQRRVTASRARQRKIRGKPGRQRRRIDPHLRHVAMRARAARKRARTSFDENVQDGFVEGGIGRVTVRLPILIGEIELDAAAQDLAAIEPDRRVGKVRPGFAVPRAELHDLDLFARRARKGFPEIARKPARLQLQLAEIARLRKERALANFRRREELRITLGARHGLNNSSTGERAVYPPWATWVRRLPARYRL